MKEMQNSKYGIASFILALIPFIFFIFKYFYGKQLLDFLVETGNDTLGWVAGGLYIFIPYIIPLFVVFFGILGLLQKNYKKGFAIAGLAIQGFVFFIAAFLYYIS